MVLLVGNKIDDESNREVATEEGLNTARELGIPDHYFVETSAKANLNVQQLFKIIASDLPGIACAPGQPTATGNAEAVGPQVQQTTG
mmetsp:Transcript_19506/g.29977  ORF Transcript_19506/g.29977 Transcript_19506/m.29977 type:complete len:87 (+) Transcript_19506:361-621(+)